MNPPKEIQEMFRKGEKSTRISLTAFKNIEISGKTVNWLSVVRKMTGEVEKI